MYIKKCMARNPQQNTYLNRTHLIGHSVFKENKPGDTLCTKILSWSGHQ
jgi:hypothetical protein